MSTPAKTMLVTGASDGIGFETARALLVLGHTVLVHGRHQARAEDAVKRLAHAGGTALPVWGDFSRMDEVVALARQVSEKAPTLDVLINNAGIYCAKRSVSGDGFEQTMGVNHFAPVLLTHHLMPNVLAARDARIVNVSSMTHDGADFDVSDLDLGKRWSAYGSYATSKFANVLFTRGLAARYPSVTACALHPGVIGTKLLKAAFSMQGATPADGARTSVFVATSPQVAGKSGAYFDNCRERAADSRTRKSALVDALWEASSLRLAKWL